ncbi:MAG TPA: hypothetical protein VFE72_00370 [Lysobacter sp.]|nr:hypothetical protein [Lysobacter sp.]
MKALALVPLLLATTACGTPGDKRGMASSRAIPVVCSAGRIDVECFRQASEICGRRGYDLFDLQGRPATVSDAQYRALEARCRE